jgi:ABC-type oligopeptide transport system substrate-binding subunit
MRGSVRRLGCAAVVATAAIGLASCGGSSGNSKSASTDSNKGTPATGSASSSSTPRRGGVLQTAFQSDPSTFDPQVCYDATCWDNMEMLFNRLYDYKADTTDLVPQAAASMPTVSNNSRQYTIELRSGMTFANGKPVTASDFVYTFSRICDPATKSPVVSFWTPVKGCTAYGKHPSGSVPGIKALSPSKLQITLTQPNAAFRYVLAMPQASVIPSGSGDRQAKQPLGSGPFQFVSFDPGRSIVLKRNTRYWDKKLPYVDGVNERLGVTPQVQLLELQKGQIDLMGDPLANSDYLTVVNNEKLKDQLTKRVSLSTYFLTMNVRMKPFDNPMVREAVSYAIDRSFLLKAVNGQGKPANDFIPPGVLGHTEENLVHDRDVAKAKQLLAKAGYPDGFTTTMYSWNTQPWTNLDPQIQQQLGDIGIKLKVKPIQQSAFFQLAATPNKAPMTITFWVADYPDGSDFFNALLSCAAAIPGGQNYPFYCNHQVDAEVAKGQEDPDSAGEHYVAAAKRMLADNPIVPLYYGSVTQVRGSRVGGFFANPIWDYMMDQYWLTSDKAGSTSGGGGLGGS